MAEKSTNFSFLFDGHEPVLHQLALGADRAFSAEPNTTVMKCRQLAEAFAQHTPAACGVWSGPDTTFAELVRALAAQNSDTERADWEALALLQEAEHRWLG